MTTSWHAAAAGAICLLATIPSTAHESAETVSYVVSGTIKSQVNDGPKEILHAGGSFYEPPGARHPVSRNASKNHSERQR